MIHGRTFWICCGDTSPFVYLRKFPLVSLDGKNWIWNTFLWSSSSSAQTLMYNIECIKANGQGHWPSKSRLKQFLSIWFWDESRTEQRTRKIGVARMSDSHQSIIIHCINKLRSWKALYKSLERALNCLRAREAQHPVAKVPRSLRVPPTMPRTLLF